MIYSSKRNRSQALAGGQVTSQKAEEFWEELANLSEDADSLNRFERRFGPIYLPESPQPVLLRHLALNTEEEGYLERQDRSDSELLREYWLIPLRNTLRKIWQSPNIEVKEWGVFKICEHFFLRGNPGLSERPLREDDYFLSLRRLGPCEQSLLHLLKCADLIRYCGNPDCKTPYFIAARRSQKYCSEPCSRPAQQQFKRKWWAEHGSERRRRAAAGKRRPTTKS